MLFNFLFEAHDGEMLLWNLLLTPKYRAEQFLNDLYASGDKLFCKFCQHNDDWKRVDMCKDTVLCTLS